jgi:hypothetical protein
MPDDAANAIVEFVHRKISNMRLRKLFRVFREKKGTILLVKLHVVVKLLNLQSLMLVIWKVRQRFCLMLKNRNIFTKRIWLVMVIYFWKIADCLESVGASTSHCPMGLHGLLQG